MPTTFRCRCCGEIIEPDHWRVPEPLWCNRCPQHLLSPSEGTIDQRTYAGQHGGDPCPFTPTEVLLNPRLILA